MKYLLWIVLAIATVGATLTGVETYQRIPLTRACAAAGGSYVTCPHELRTDGCQCIRRILTEQKIGLP